MDNRVITNNKGFTLIELIIVVAIIAILATVLAPQYLQYVERTRESNDLQVATSLIDATQVALSNPDNNIPSGYIIEVLWTSGDLARDAGYEGLIVVRTTLRTSIFNDSDPTFNRPALPSTVNTDDLVREIVTIMGAELETASSYNLAGTYVGYIGEPESATATDAVFGFHIRTDTGEIALAKWDNGGLVNDWLNIGLKITPAPY